MDVRRSALESAAYARNTLAVSWRRWLIFVLLGLPWAALSSLATGWKAVEGTAIRWELVPWHEAGLLICAGSLCNFLLSGYIVRLLKGDPAPPEFDNPHLLLLDGIRFHVIPLAWMLAPAVLAYCEYLVASAGPVSAGRWGGVPGTVVVLILLALQILIILFALQYAIVGGIRFARTGSIREAFALNAIRLTLGRIGIVNYYLGIGILAVVWLAFSSALSLLSAFGTAGSLLSLALAPFVTVFCFRFMAHACDDDPDLARAVPEAKAVLPLRRLVIEIAAWLMLVIVLVVLCFTPLVLVAGSIGRFFG
jgi:hypothetical protein